MTSVFKNVLSGNIGTTPSTVLTTNSAATTTVIGLSLTNTSTETSLVSIQLQDTIASTSAYFIKNVPIPPNQSLRIVTGGEKLILGPLTNVIAVSNSDASVDLVMSWVEIS